MHKCRMCFGDIVNDTCNCAPRAPCYTNYDEIRRIALALQGKVTGIETLIMYSDYPLKPIEESSLPSIRRFLRSIFDACDKGNEGDEAPTETREGFGRRIGQDGRGQDGLADFDETL